MREIKFKAFHKADKKMYDVIGFSLGKWFLRGKSYPMPRSAIELLQYTGMKDKNGVEVYEGDVVEMNSIGPGGVDLKGVVEMVEGSFYIRSHENQLSTHLFNELSVIEIIGNVYEHPHLPEEDE